MNNDINELVKSIKRSFRLRMNGVTSQSIREKNTNYKINWGISNLELKEMAKDYGKNQQLALQLWNEDIRECKILATLIMPSNEMTPEIADEWVGQIETQDLAEFAAFNLFQHIKDVQFLTFKWIASERIISQLIGYQTLSRLFLNGFLPNEINSNQYLILVSKALVDENIGLKHAAMNSVVRFSELGQAYQKAANERLQTNFY